MIEWGEILKNLSGFTFIGTLEKICNSETDNNKKMTEVLGFPYITFKKCTPVCVAVRELSPHVCWGQPFYQTQGDGISPMKTSKLVNFTNSKIRIKKAELELKILIKAVTLKKFAV